MFAVPGPWAKRRLAPAGRSVRRPAPGSAVGRLDFVAIAYPSRQAAMAGRVALLGLAPDRLPDFGDAIVASVDAVGSIDLDQLVNLWALDRKGGVLRALLVGLLFLHPLLAVLPGDAAQAISAALADFGLDDGATTQLRGMLDPGHAVLFLLATPGAAAMLGDLDSGHIVVEPVDTTAFDALEAAFALGQQASSRQQNRVYRRDYE